MSPSANEAAWTWQWSHLEDTSETLFREWIHPNRIEDFAGKEVLDAGCGGGHHLRLVAPIAKEVVGVDLSCAELAADRCRDLPNVSTRSGDVAVVDLGRRFDVVYCIGVLHHTDDPTRSFRNLVRHVKPGGRMIVWVYSHEGNFLNRTVVEPLKRALYGRWPRPALLALAHLLTLLLYVPIYTVYLLPLRRLPFYEYFRNFRRLSYRRNLLNVFDKLNAPQTHFIRRERVEAWFATGFRDVHVSPYVGVSWRASGTRVAPGRDGED
jgi:SAM-dependent methyltransferase